MPQFHFRQCIFNGNQNVNEKKPSNSEKKRAKCLSGRTVKIHWNVLYSTKSSLQSNSKFCSKIFLNNIWILLHLKFHRSQEKRTARKQEKAPCCLCMLKLKSKNCIMLSSEFFNKTFTCMLFCVKHWCSTNFCILKKIFWIEKDYIIIFPIPPYSLSIEYKILNWTKQVCVFFPAILFCFYSFTGCYTNLSDTAFNPSVQNCMLFIFLSF